MILLNVDFQEQYKQLDALCKDIFSSCEGVSAYIREMEDTPAIYSRCILDWDDYYKDLKHLRWLRNTLAHEVGAFNSELCTESDINLVRQIYKNILSASDPLVQVRIIKEERTRQRKLTLANQQNPNNETVKKTKDEKKISLWLKIKNWFCKK